MTRFFGAGRASALAALLLLGIGASTEASAQLAASAEAPLVNAVGSKPATASAIAPAVVASAALPKPTPSLLTATASTAAQPLASIAATLPVTHAGLWPLVWANMTGASLDEEQNCIATAVYFEARGEPFDGQLAVAEVVMNRALSGRYPTSYCAVVKQPWQFSFVRSGRFPRVDESSPAWAYAQAISRIAKQRLADALPDDVLWYHADYVAPVWGRRLSRVEKIGAHIFYRA